MADEGDPPGSLTRRYGDVPAERKALLYLARRYLGLSPADWDGLSWDTQLCYIAGLRAEGLYKPPDDDRPSGGTGFEALAGDLGSGGYTVITRPAPAP